MSDLHRRASVDGDTWGAVFSLPSADGNSLPMDDTTRSPISGEKWVIATGCTLHSSGDWSSDQLPWWTSSGHSAQLDQPQLSPKMIFVVFLA